MTVVPTEVLTRRLYSSPAIALSMVLFGICSMSLHAIRELVSPFTAVGPTAAAGWCTVLRWVAAARAKCLFEMVRAVPNDWPRRKAAARIAMTLAAYAAPPSLDVVSAAFVGAHSQ
jgi:hypothetical protein